MGTHKLNITEYNESVAKKAFQVEEIKSRLDNVHSEKSSEDINTEDSRYLNENLSLGKRSSPESQMVSALKPSKAEIEDKANTRCSSCRVELGSRKRFVRHCQLVHKVKLKTRSGLAVPPPSPEAGLPTSLEDPVLRNQESDSSFPRTGRDKEKVTGFDLSSMDEAVKRKKMAKGDGSVSCNQCHKMFSSVGNVEKHKRFTCRPVSDNTDLMGGGVPCDRCGKVFANKANIKRHKRFSCSLIQKVK